MHAPTSLSDPRQYTALALERNLLLAEALQQREPSPWLVQKIAEDLSLQQGARFSVALAMAPSAEVYRCLWQGLGLATQHVIAWPVLFVVTPGQPLVLPDLPQWPGMFPVWLAPEDLHAIMPSTMHALRSFADLPQESHPIDTTLSQDCVHVRYWLGLKQDIQFELGEACPKPLVYGLMQTLNQNIQSTGGTHHAMPGAPLPIFAAYQWADLRARDIACQIFLSQRLRELRQKAYRPSAWISTPEANMLQIRLQANEHTWDSERWVWPLLPGDDWQEILDLIQSFLADCRVAQIFWQEAQGNDVLEG